MYTFHLAQNLQIADMQIAIFRYICAKQKNIPFVICMKDLTKDETNEELLAIFSLFEINYNEVYYQNNNLKFYRYFAAKLLQEKKAFSCFCDNAKEPYDGMCEHLSDFDVLNNTNLFSIRIKKPKNEKNFDDFIILNHKKYPTDAFANGVDDMLYNNTHIITNTNNKNLQKRLHVSKTLGFNEAISYTFLPQILCENDEYKNVIFLLENGFLASAILNYIFNLTCNQTKIFTLSNAIKHFNIKNISSKNVTFDMHELKSINKEHIKALDDDVLCKFLGYNGTNISNLAKYYTNKSATLNEIKQNLKELFSKKNLKSCEELEVKNAIKHAPMFENFDEFINHLSNKINNDKVLFDTICTLFCCEKSELSSLYSHVKYYLKEITSL